MINDRMRHGTYKVKVDNNLDVLKTSLKVFYTSIFMGNTNIMQKLFQNDTNLDNFMALLRLINLALLRIQH